MAQHVRAERWRSLGLLIVLLAGTVLVVSLVERGHDPVSRVRTGTVDGLLLPASGEPLLVIQPAANGTASVAALDPEDGSRRWALDLPGRPPDWAVSGSTLVVPLPYPEERVLLVDVATGQVRSTLHPGGVPRGVAVSPTHLAVSLQSSGNPVVLYDRMPTEPQEVNRFRFRGLVTDMALAGDTLAVGTRAGEARVVDASGPTVTFNRSVPLLVQDLDLSGDGTRLLLGGRAFLDPGPGPGLLQMYNVGDEPARRWSYGDAATPPVGLVELSGGGERVLATLEVPGDYRLVALDGDSGNVTGTASTGGLLTRGKTARGVTLSPGGEWVASASPKGAVVLRSMPTLDTLWRWEAAGATSLDFAEASPERFAANARLAPGAGYDAVAVFDVDDEAFLDDASRLLPALLLVEAGTGLLVILARGSGRRR